MPVLPPLQMPPANLPPRPLRVFEDYAAGTQVVAGFQHVVESEILKFAGAFDPQYFHTQPDKAARSDFHGLIASGWHPGALMMRLLVEHFLPDEAGVESPGVDELRWLAPVRPGDTLALRVTIVETRLSRSKPDRGVVRTLLEAINQDGVTVMSLKAANFFLTRAGLIEARKRGL